MAQPLRIGLNLYSNDPFWIEVNEAVHQRCQQLGIDLIPIFASHFLPQQRDQRVTTHLEELIRQDPAHSPFTFEAGQEEAVWEELKKQNLNAIIGWDYPDSLTLRVLGAGIPIIAQGTEIAMEHPLLIKRQGLYSAGHLLGTYLAERLHGSGRILVAGGLLNNKPVGDGRNRLAGVRDVFQSFDKVNWNHIPTLWDYETAHFQLYAALNARPEPLDAIVGLSDSIALAARDAARSWGCLRPETLIAGINGDPLVIAAIAEGSFTATVELSATDWGQEMVDVAYQAARGLPHPDQVYFKRMRLVTSQNVTEVAVQKLMQIANLPNRMVLIRRYEEQQRLTQEALKESNAELEQFAYIASHDLQEPLRTITSFLELITECCSDRLDTEADDYIARSVDGAQRMQRMISDLLAYASAGSQNTTFQTVDCEIAYLTAISGLEPVIKETGAVISYDPLPTVMGDEIRLSAVFQNLIGNALKYRSAQPPAIHIGVKRSGDYWQFSLTDNGIGISPEYLGKIFEIFVRGPEPSKYPGTGIGLAICKRVIERHGGRIWVDSQVGQGTTFYFTLPVMNG